MSARPAHDLALRLVHQARCTVALSIPVPGRAVSSGPLRSGLALLLLTLGVSAMHLWLAQRLWPQPLGLALENSAPKRIEVVFVRELAPAAPPAVVPALAPPAPPRVAVAAVAPAAAASASVSAAESVSAELLPPLPVSTAAPLPTPTPAAPPLQSLATAEREPDLAPTLAASPAGLEPPAALAAELPARLPAVAQLPPAAHAEIWPPSTRLSYVLNGHYKGPVEGQARVEWLRNGTRYQVHMDVSVGPSFAPLMSRRVSSEGEITATGLLPQRFDEVTRALLRDPRQLTVLLGADRVRLANGQERPRPTGVQDSASQFVQLTWLFTTQPELLKAGRSIELPLALPRTLENWTYDVVGPETLHTPAGIVEAVHVKPRRDVPRDARPGGDLAAELWVAPSLQYLPVRILIRQDANNYLDLQLERLPQQAAPGR